MSARNQLCSSERGPPTVRWLVRVQRELHARSKAHRTHLRLVEAIDALTTIAVGFCAPLPAVLLAAALSTRSRTRSAGFVVAPATPLGLDQGRVRGGGLAADTAPAAAGVTGVGADCVAGSVFSTDALAALAASTVVVVASAGSRGRYKYDPAPVAPARRKPAPFAAGPHGRRLLACVHVGCACDVSA